MTQETHCACLFEWRPTPDFSGKPPVQTDECGFHSQQRLPLERRLSEALANVNELNDVLRAAGWGQGEIDSASETLYKAESRAEAAERELDDCLATLKDERYCHGQTVAQLKKAASEEIQQQVRRAEIAENALKECAAYKFDKDLKAAEARAEAMAGALRELGPDALDLPWRAKRIIKAALSHPLGGKT